MLNIIHNYVCFCKLYYVLFEVVVGFDAYFFTPNCIGSNILLINDTTIAVRTGFEPVRRTYFLLPLTEIGIAFNQFRHLTPRVYITATHKRSLFYQRPIAPISRWLHHVLSFQAVRLSAVPTSARNRTLSPAYHNLNQRVESNQH